jgi:hypothetical protein
MSKVLTYTDDPSEILVEEHTAAFARVSGSDATTTSNTLVDVTGLSIPLLANSVYQFEAIINGLSSTVHGTGYGINFSDSGATIEAQISGTSGPASHKSLRISALNSAASPFLAGVNADGGIRITGVITTGSNAGNLLVQHLKVNSGTGTVFINSYLTATKRS